MASANPENSRRRQTLADVPPEPSRGNCSHGLLHGTEGIDCRSGWFAMTASRALSSSSLQIQSGHLIFSSHRRGRFCKRSRTLRWVRTSVFMRVVALELLVQNHVGRFWSSRRCCKRLKILVGERGFEPPTPWSRRLVSRRINTLAPFGCVHIR